MAVSNPDSRRGEKIFVKFEDVLGLAEEEDKQEFALRGLCFKLLFWVFVVPFILLQGRFNARFQVQQSLKNTIERTEFSEVKDLTRKVNVSVFGGQKQVMEIPHFWLPNSATFNDSFTIDPNPNESDLTYLTYGQIQKESQFWDWVQQVVAQEILFPNFCLFHRNFSTVVDPLDPTHSFRVDPYDRFWAFDNAALLSQIGYLNENYCKKLSPGLFNYLLYGTRIRGVQVEPSTGCENFLGSASKCFPCFGSFEEANEAKTNARHGNMTSVNSNLAYTNTFVYDWEPATQLLEDPVASIGGTFPGSGFAVVLPFFQSSWFAVVNKIYQYRTGVISWKDNTQFTRENNTARGRFFQPSTRGIIVVFTFYNPNLNLYSYVECVISVGASGSWLPVVNYFIAPAPQQTPQNQAEVTELVFACLTFLYILLSYIRFWRNATVFRYKPYWGLLALAIDIAIIVLEGFILQWIFTSYFYLSGAVPVFPTAESFQSRLGDPLWICPTDLEADTGGTKFAGCGGSPPFYSGVGLYAKSYHTMQGIYAWVFLLTQFKTLQDLLVFDRFRLFNEVNFQARYNFLYFAIIYLVMFIGYSFAGYLFFSDSLLSYMSMGKATFRTLLDYIRVDVAYADLIGVNRYAQSFGAFFFFSFFFIFTWVFACVLLAIIYNSWQIVKERAYRVEKKYWAQVALQEKLQVLYAKGSENEQARFERYSREVVAGGRKIGWGRELIRDLCHGDKSVIPKEIALIRLKEWVIKVGEKESVVFLNKAKLQEVLRVSNVDHYFKKLADKSFSQLEVDQLLRVDIDKVSNAGPSLSTRKSLGSAVENVAKDQDTWLRQIDTQLQTLKVQQRNSTKDSQSLMRYIGNLLKCVESEVD